MFYNASVLCIIRISRKQKMSFTDILNVLMAEKDILKPIFCRVQGTAVNKNLKICGSEEDFYMNILNTSITFKNNLHNIFSDIESQYNLPNGSFDITDSKAQTQDNGILHFVSIVEPPYPKSLSSSSRRSTVFKYSIKNQIKLFVPRSLSAKLPDALKSASTIKDLQSDAAFLHFYYAMADSSIYDLIKIILCDCIDNYTPSSSFGCCSKYQECSDLGSCIHENNLYAKGCYYRKNLESGRGFLKNANIQFS